MSRTKKALLIIFLILIVDQVLKIWIKTHLAIGDEIVVFKDWFILHFVENNGMAFGFEFAGEYGKNGFEYFSYTRRYRHWLVSVQTCQKKGNSVRIHCMYFIDFCWCHR